MKGLLLFLLEFLYPFLYNQAQSEPKNKAIYLDRGAIKLSITRALALGKMSNETHLSKLPSQFFTPKIPTGRFCSNINDWVKGKSMMKPPSPIWLCSYWASKSSILRPRGQVIPGIRTAMIFWTKIDINTLSRPLVRVSLGVLGKKLSWGEISNRALALPPERDFRE